MEATRLRAGKISLAARSLADTVDVRATADRVTDDIMVQVWPTRDDPEFRVAMGASVEGNVAAIFDILRGRVDLAAAQPLQALEFADTAAQLGVPVSELERAYRVGLASVWSQWLELATAHAMAQGLALGDFIDGPSLTIMSYVDHILVSVTSRYEERAGQLQQTRRQVRRLLVDQLLDGSIDRNITDLDERLDYCVADAHLALLVHPADRTLPESTVLRLRGAADARAALVHQHGPGSWIVWLGRPGGYDRQQLQRLRRALAQETDAVSVSQPGSGVEGMRSSHHQAVDTARVQLALGLAEHRCVWAPEVRLEALLLTDEVRAARFVSDELGRLAEQDTLARRLRETLLAWLSTSSHVSAAATLGVHENTIRNRIRQAEELLDAPLATRRTELQVALRLERVLRAEHESR
ncbi:MAG: helix-turn-helix domain-containing protein [Solirubrobacterales bacterium]|nr:helix-turn-helix domain-containing protein [Solirubrobacterales bacterium]